LLLVDNCLLMQRLNFGINLFVLEKTFKDTKKISLNENFFVF